jgi:hypothetical protein
VVTIITSEEVMEVEWKTHLGEIVYYPSIILYVWHIITFHHPRAAQQRMDHRQQIIVSMEESTMMMGVLHPGLANQPRRH